MSLMNSAKGKAKYYTWGRMKPCSLWPNMGILVGGKLNMCQQCALMANVANCILGLMRKSIAGRLMQVIS